VSREVRFSFDTEEEKALFAAYASGRGMSLSAMAKTALYAYRTRNRTGSHHPTKGKGRTSAPRILGQSDMGVEV